jgi:hypothetical protein
LRSELTVGRLSGQNQEVGMLFHVKQFAHGQKIPYTDDAESNGEQAASRDGTPSAASQRGKPRRRQTGAANRNDKRARRNRNGKPTRQPGYKPEIHTEIQASMAQVLSSAGSGNRRVYG